MSEISSLISAVDEKLDKVLLANDAVRSQLRKQELRNQQLLEDLEEKIKKIAQLEEQITRLRESAVATEGSSVLASQDTKTKISELVREIDKCISLLNR